MNMRTVEIVGGGVAGLSLGVALRRAGVPVLIFEALPYPRHRPCGEFISGLDADTLECVALGKVFEKLPRCRNVAWFGRAPSPRQWKLPEPAYVVSRYELDARLADVFCQAGGRLETNVRVPATENRPGMVFATGRRAERTSPWLGLKMHMMGLPVQGGLEFHTGDQAYVGLCAVEGGRVNVCGLFRRRARLVTNRATAMVEYVRACGMHALAGRLARAEPVTDSICAVGGIHFGRQQRMQPAERVDIGDAFAVTPPFTGNGMAMAIQSAACALEPLITWARGYEEWQTAANIIHWRQDGEFRKRLWRARGLHPLLLGRAVTRVADIVSRFRLTPMPMLCRFVH